MTQTFVIAFVPNLANMATSPPTKVLLFFFFYILKYLLMFHVDGSYLQSLPCRPRCRLPLWLWRLSLSGSCALPSAWSWHSAAPLLWSLHPHPCRTDQKKTREEEQHEHPALFITTASESGEEGGFSGSLESLRKVLDSDLFKGVFELFYANHPSCFCQKLWGHQVYKVLKVDSATNLGGGQRKRTLDTFLSISISDLYAF